MEHTDASPDMSTSMLMRHPLADEIRRLIQFTGLGRLFSLQWGVTEADPSYYEFKLHCQDDSGKIKKSLLFTGENEHNTLFPALMWLYGFLAHQQQQGSCCLAV